MEYVVDPDSCECCICIENSVIKDDYKVKVRLISYKKSLPKAKNRANRYFFVWIRGKNAEKNRIWCEYSPRTLRQCMSWGDIKHEIQYLVRWISTLIDG